MSKFNFTYTKWQILAFIVSIIVILGTLPSLLFGFGQKERDSNASVVEAKSKMVKTESTKKKLITEMPNSVDKAAKLANEVANAQTILIKQNSSRINKSSKDAPTIAELEKAKSVMKNDVVDGQTVDAWGFYSDWKVVPSVSALNNANTIGVIFDVFNAKNELMMTVSGSYSVDSGMIAIGTTSKTKAYNDAGVEGD